MHICFLNPIIEYYSPVCGGAVATCISQVSQQLLARGHQVTVLTPASSEEQYSIGRVVPLSVRTRSDLSLVPRKISGIRRRLAGWDWPCYEYYQASITRALRNLTPAPDVIVTSNDLIAAWYLRQLLPKAAIIAWLHNEVRTNPRFYRRAVSAPDRFVCVSEYVRKWTQAEYELPADKLRVMLNGVNLTSFQPRDGYLDPVSELKVLYIGRIDPNKGPDIAADAVHALQAEGLNVSLTVAGGLWFYGNEDPMRNSYFRMLKDKMDAVSATYLGHIPRAGVPELIASHDVCCVLSRSEDPCPLVTFEAMASGCAVIGSTRGGIPDSCAGAGILVDPNNVEAVISGMRSLATDHECLKAAKRRSVDRAAHTSWSTTADGLESALRGLSVS